MASRDIVAPEEFTYVSQIQTAAAREQARKSITPIDSPSDTSVARQQVERLRNIFDYLDTVRADPYGSLPEKSAWIEAIPDLSLSNVVIDTILVTPDETWEETKQEALRLLDQTMRAVVKEGQLGDIRHQLPTFIALDTPQDQADVIGDIVSDMIKPNTFPDEARTQDARREAAEAISDITVTVEQNELIISAGELVTPAKLEKLNALVALQEPEFSAPTDFIAPILLMTLATIIIAVYLFQYVPFTLVDTKRLYLLVTLLLISLAVAKVMIPVSEVAYLYPIAAVTMMIVTIIDLQLVFLLTTVLALLIGYMAVDSPQATIIYLILSGWAGALALGRSQRVAALLWAGLYVALANLGVIIIFHAGIATSDTEAFGFLLLQGLLNSIVSSSLALIGLFIIGSLAGITTSIQLMELARPTHPLLRQLLLKAPGTYAHSLMVSNLGEQAAERIGADSMLVRVMAYYHDIGKIQRPYFFVENQPEGINVHEKLEPQISAQIIISHVTDGLDLAAKYRLPPAIKDGIAQHQGTDLVKYFYYQALKAAEGQDIQVDESHFRYPGPKPQIKETGILMLADISETSVRALKPGSVEEIDQIVKKMINDKLESGELDECNLTIADLHHIRTAFVDILQGVHHPRIKYPDQIKAEESQATQQEEVEQPEPVEPPDADADEQPAPAPNAKSRLQPLPADGQTRPSRLVRRE